MLNLTVMATPALTPLRKFSRIISVERDTEKFVTFNGMRFPPEVPGWVVWFALVGDPVEYNVRVDARDEREARSLALITLRSKGVMVGEPS